MKRRDTSTASLVDEEDTWWPGTTSWNAAPSRPSREQASETQRPGDLFLSAVRRDRRLPGKVRSNSRFFGPSLTIPPGSPGGPPAPLDAESIGELFARNAARLDAEKFASYRVIETNRWESVSWRQAAAHVLETAVLLEKCGVRKGDRVAILSSTRYEWVIADLAIVTLGAISTPVYQSLTPAEAGFILWETECDTIFVENQEQFQKIQTITDAPFTIPQTEEQDGGQIRFAPTEIISFDSVTPAADSTLAIHKMPNLPPSAGAIPVSESTIKLLAYVADLSRNDIASIVYTSGTTGAPKGVVQSHHNHLSMIDSVILSGLLKTGHDIFLYLPLAHSFARLICYVAMGPGGSMILPAVVSRSRSVFDAKAVLYDLAHSHPLLFPSVPRIFEKIMEGLLSPHRLGERLARWAIMQRKVKGSRTGILANKLIKKVRKKLFGERLLYCVSGGAPISKEVLEFFKLMDVLICEGYGLTETTPAMAANTENGVKFGTVGRLFPCNEVKIEESDGEILVRGENVALGYWKRPKATAEAWDSAGWFRTGDIGELDEEGYLAITDRKKDIIVTAGGKKVPPALIEGKLKLSPYVSQALVFGERKPYLVALVTLNEPAVRKWGVAHGIAEDLPFSELANHSEVLKLAQHEVKVVNEELATYEQIKKVAVLPEDFSIENGLLTPSLKLKRKLATERYLPQIEALYSGHSEG